MRRWHANRIANEAHLIRQPALILWGEADEHISLSDGMRLREAIPRSRLIVFRNSGHLPPVEQPENFVKVVTDFCGAAQLAAEETNSVKSIKTRQQISQG